MSPRIPFGFGKVDKLHDFPYWALGELRSSVVGVYSPKT